MEDEVLHAENGPEKAMVSGCPSQMRALHLCWSYSFILFLCRKARHDVQTGSTCIQGQLGDFVA